MPLGVKTIITFGFILIIHEEKNDYFRRRNIKHTENWKIAHSKLHRLKTIVVKKESFSLKKGQ